jgi:hypothetical protein
MKTSSKLIIVLGIITVFAGGLAAGVPLGTLLLVAALLACPAMMFFGMSMHRHGGAGANCPNCEKKQGEQNHQNTSSVSRPY